MNIDVHIPLSVLLSILLIFFLYVTTATEISNLIVFLNRLVSLMGFSDFAI